MILPLLTRAKPSISNASTAVNKLSTSNRCSSAKSERSYWWPSSALVKVSKIPVNSDRGVEGSRVVIGVVYWAKSVC